MDEKKEILEKLRKKLPIFQEKYRVKSLGLFGSYIRGDQKKKSDIDLLVEFEEPIGLIRFITIENELSEFLGKKVDLVMKTALKPRIRENILKEVILV